MPRYARVLVDESGGRVFDYALPTGAAEVLVVGSRVRVPIRTRTSLGTIIGLTDETEHEGVKEISTVVSAEPILSPILIRIAEWIADYYCCALETALRTVLPQVIRRAEMGHKTQLYARLARPVPEEELAALEKKAPLQAGVVRHLAAATAPVRVADLAKECDASHPVITALVKKGLVLSEPLVVERDPFENETFVAGSKLELNAEQLEVFSTLR